MLFPEGHGIVVGPGGTQGATMSIAYSATSMMTSSARFSSTCTAFPVGQASNVAYVWNALWATLAQGITAVSGTWTSTGVYPTMCWYNGGGLCKYFFSLHPVHSIPPTTFTLTRNAS